MTRLEGSHVLFDCSAFISVADKRASINRRSRYPPEKCANSSAGHTRRSRPVYAWRRRSKVARDVSKRITSHGRYASLRSGVGGAALGLPIQALRLVISTYTTRRRKGEGEARRPAASGNLEPALSRLRRCTYSGAPSPIGLHDPGTRNCAHNLRAGNVAEGGRRRERTKDTCLTLAGGGKKECKKTVTVGEGRKEERAKRR